MLVPLSLSSIIWYWSCVSMEGNKHSACVQYYYNYYYYKRTWLKCHKILGLQEHFTIRRMRSVLSMIQRNEQSIGDSSDTVGPKHRKRSSDLRRCLKAVSDTNEVTLDGRLFHTHEALTGNAWSPMVEWHVGGMSVDRLSVVNRSIENCPTFTSVSVLCVVLCTLYSRSLNTTPTRLRQIRRNMMMKVQLKTIFTCTGLCLKRFVVLYLVAVTVHMWCGFAFVSYENCTKVL